VFILAGRFMRKLDFTNTDFHRDKGKTHTVARLKKVALISPTYAQLKDSPHLRKDVANVQSSITI
jgi:hypothetical protein